MKGARRRTHDLVVAGLVLLCAAGSAVAQNLPLRTDPATTAAAGTLVVETGFDAIAAEPSYLTGVERTRWDGPLVRLVYSPTGHIEFAVDWVARVGVHGEQNRGGAPSSDWGDLTLRAKWRVVDGREGRPTIGGRFGVILPETSYEDELFRPLGLGPNTIRAFVEGLLTQPLGTARLDANLGLLVHDEVFRPHEQRDFLSYGLSVTWPAGRRVEILAEVAGRAGEGTPGAEQRSEARAGVRLGRGRVRGALALRRGLAPADGRWGVTAGLVWTARSSKVAP